MQEKNYNENLDEMIEKAKNGDLAAQNFIVEENMGLVRSVVKRFLGRGHEAEDLFQIGCIGLIKSIKKFDTGFNVKFSTYAVPMIMGEIKRFIRDDGIIKVSRSLKELAVKVLNMQEIIKKENIEPTVAEIARRLNVSAEEVAVALDAGIKPESLYAPVGDENDGKLLIDKIESKEDPEAEILNKLLVREILDEFDERERKIIILRYFKQKTQSKIAEMLGISQVQVSRIEKKILIRMREKLVFDEERNNKF